VVLVAGLQAAGFAALSGSPAGCVLAGACVLGSRVSLATCCARPVPPARPEGLGATVAGTVPVLAAALAWLALAGALAGLLAVLPVQRAPWHALVPVVLAVVLSLLLVRRCTSRLGGVTGDVLGAGVEASLAVLLLALT
jgi:adenosylcobinamide-GDP ribazoletransferase